MSNYVYILIEIAQGSTFIIGVFADKDKAGKEKSALEYKTKKEGRKEYYSVETHRIINSKE